MSQENVEIVRLAYQRLQGGDVDGLLDLCSEDLEFRDLPALPGSGVFIGRDGFRHWYAQLIDAFEDLQFVAREILDAGDHIVVATEATGHGRGSGAAVMMHFSSTWTLKGGKILRHVAFDSREEALEAVGLSA